MAFYQLLAWILCAVFAALAMLHLHWAFGGQVASSGAVPTIGDRKLFEPGPVSTLAVAVLLILAAIVGAVRGGLLDVGLPAWVSRVGTWVIAFVFAARAVGEFRYVGFFKRVKDTLFARRDTRIYSPICVVLSALAAGLATLAP